MHFFGDFTLYLIRAEEAYIKEHLGIFSFNIIIYTFYLSAQTMI